MQKRVYSKSLKTMRKYEFFDNGIEKIIEMQNRIRRQEDFMKPRQRPSNSVIETKKQLITNRFFKTSIEKQLDDIIKDLVKDKKLDISINKIGRKHSYKDYRIETQPKQINKNKQKPSSLISKSKKNLISSPENLLPKISNSPSKNKFEKIYSRKLKTEQDTFERLIQDPKQNILEYINIDNVIRQYRAGMTSLIKGVYSNPYNPYKKMH